MSAPHWWATGLLFENCSCQLICPAHVSFKQRCENDRCIGHWAVHIDDGRFGDVSLTDRNAVVVFESPVRMYEGQWVQRLYLDDRASDAQRRALKLVFSGEAGGPWQTLGRFVATRLETRVVPIRLERREGEQQMTIPNVLTTTVTAIAGRDGHGPAVLSNLYNVIHGAVHVLALGRTSCSDPPLDFSIQGTHGLSSEFSWSGGTTPVV